jgi:hypothetical protein
MSYEGYIEFLCEEGHYWTADANVFSYGSMEERREAFKCKICAKSVKYIARVDETNGIDETDPYTMQAPKELLGYTDIPCTDHHGNKYFTRAKRYKPVESNPEYQRWEIKEK